MRMSIWKYEYGQLQDDRRIRLMSLMPSNDPTDPIRCQLQVHSLTPDSQIPQYTALSYAWGDPTSNIHIECEGAILSVTNSCFRALYHIRELQRDSNRALSFSPNLWIDVICIDQSNQQEKIAQIKLMKDIYRRAETVLCFLEDSYNHVDIRDLNQLGKLSTPIWRRPHQETRSGINWIKWKANGGILGVDSGPNKWEPTLRRLCESKYWTRLWTFQEALLSRRKIVLSGTDIIEWDTIGILLQEASSGKYKNSNKSLLMPIQFHTLATNSPMLHLLLERKHTFIAERVDKTFTQSLSLEISRILSLSSELKTTDPRDKILALMGLMTTLKIEPSIDYSRPMALILADTIIAFNKTSWLSHWESKPEEPTYDFLEKGSAISSYRVAAKSPVSKRNNEEGNYPEVLMKRKRLQAIHWSYPVHSRLLMSNAFVPVGTDISPGERVNREQQEYLDWSEDDNCTNSMASPSSSNESDEVDYRLLVRSLAKSLLTRSRESLAYSVSVQLAPFMNLCAPDEKSSLGQNLSSGGNERIKDQGESSKGKRTKSRIAPRNRKEYSDDESDQEHPKKKNKMTDSVELEKLLACPFYQRNPHRHPIHRSCSGPGWASISRLKQVPRLKSNSYY